MGIVETRNRIHHTIDEMPLEFLSFPVTGNNRLTALFSGRVHYQ